jgi:peptidyl-prolyl cis-trans isomerase D
MIRLLQQDSRLMKWLFAVIIGFAAITMVITLVPGIFDNGATNDASVFATVKEPGYFGRVFGENTPIKTVEVNQMAARQLQQQHLPEQFMPYLVPRAGQILVQRAILKHESDRLNLQVSDDDLRNELRTGVFAQYLFPGGNYIGDDAYINFVQNAFGGQLSRADFESQVKGDMELNRLQALITGGVTVSDAAVKAAYLKDGTKVKFDYVVISADDVRKSINPPDAELEAFFKKNAARYSSAVPETRKIEYASFDASNLPGGKPTVSDADVLAYYNAHKDQYTVKEQVKTRHILIAVPAGADAKTDAAAKAKAQDLLKQIRGGASFADLASKNSDDPGSKTQGGELPLYPTSGLDPAYAKAAMALNPGQTSDVVRSQFGYHIIQTEQKQPAHTKSVDEVKTEIVPLLEQQRAGAAEQTFAATLAADAKKNGLDKAAASRGLHVVTTDYVAKDGVIPGLADGSAMLTQAFAEVKGADPASVSTGDGYAVFQIVDVKPAHAPDFATYKAHILEDYREQQVPQLMNAQLNKLEDRAKVLNDLGKAAKEMNLAVKTSDLVGKDGQVPDLGAMSGPGGVAFTLAKGAISGPINTGRSGVVLSVVDKQEPTAEDIAKNFSATKEGLLNQQRDEIFRIYVGELTQKYEKGGAVRYSKKAAEPGLPLGN